MEPDPVSFPTDRGSLFRCVRAFIEVLTERVDGADGLPGTDLHLPLDLTTDQLVQSLLAFDRGMAHGERAPVAEGDVDALLDKIRRLLTNR